MEINMLKKDEKSKKPVAKKVATKKGTAKWPSPDGYVNLQIQDDHGHWNSIGGIQMYLNNPSGDVSKDNLHNEQKDLMEAGSDVFDYLFKAGRIRANMNVIGASKNRKGGYSIPEEKEELEQTG